MTIGQEESNSKEVEVTQQRKPTTSEESGFEPEVFSPPRPLETKEEGASPDGVQHRETAISEDSGLGAKSQDSSPRSSGTKDEDSSSNGSKEELNDAGLLEGGAPQKDVDVLQHPRPTEEDEKPSEEEAKKDGESVEEKISSGDEESSKDDVESTDEDSGLQESADDEMESGSRESLAEDEGSSVEKIVPGPWWENPYDMVDKIVGVPYVPPPVGLYKREGNLISKSIRDIYRDLNIPNTDIDPLWKELRFSITLGIGLNDRDERGMNALMYSVKWSAPISRLLLNRGINVNTIDLYGRTALHHAVLEETDDRMNQLECIKLLIAYGINVDANYRDLIQQAAMSCQYAAVVELVLYLKANEDPFLKIQWYSLLKYAWKGAIQTKRFEVLAWLLEWKTNLDGEVLGGMNSLMIAAKIGNLQICKLMLKLGANPQIYDKDTQVNAYHIACQEDQLDVLEHLLRREWINNFTAEGLDMFYFAALNGSYNVFDHLMAEYPKIWPDDAKRDLYDIIGCYAYITMKDKRRAYGYWMTSLDINTEKDVKDVKEVKMVKMSPDQKNPIMKAVTAATGQVLDGEKSRELLSEAFKANNYKVMEGQMGIKLYRISFNADNVKKGVAYSSFYRILYDNYLSYMHKTVWNPFGTYPF